MTSSPMTRGNATVAVTVPSVCAASLWTVPKGKKARLAPKYRELCMECAACYAMCEPDAIDFRYPNGGTGIIIKHG